MPGFFTHFKNLIDLRRIGILIGSNHRYSTTELLDRAFIIITTILSGYTIAQINNKEKTGISNYSACFLFAFLGFSISHMVVIFPLLKKRYRMNQAISEILERIEIKLGNIPDEDKRVYITSRVNSIENIIFDMSLGKSSISEMLGFQKRFFLKIETAVDQEEPIQVLQMLKELCEQLEKEVENATLNKNRHPCR